MTLLASLGWKSALCFACSLAIVLCIAWLAIDAYRQGYEQRQIRARDKRIAKLKRNLRRQVMTHRTAPCSPAVSRAYLRALDSIRRMEQAT